MLFDMLLGILIDSILDFEKVYILTYNISNLNMSRSKSGKNEWPEILKQLGKGGYGVTYLANYHHNLVAFKKSHILKSDIDDKHSRYHAMLKFYEDVAKKYPGHFTQLIKHAIIENCDFDYENETGNKNYKTEVHKSPYCLYMVTSPVLEDTQKHRYNNLISVLDDQSDIEKLAANRSKIRNEIYSFLIQYVYMYYVMEAHGWYHPDSKWKNVMYIKDENKTIDINLNNDAHDQIIEDKSNNIVIPTYGKRWYLIDYDPMYSDTFYQGKEIDSGAWKTAKKSRHVYLARTVEFMLYQPFWKPVLERNLRITNAHKSYELIINNPKTKYIKELLPKLDEYDTLKESAIALALVLEPEMYFKYLGLDNLLDENEYDKYLKLTKDGQYFNPEDLKYFIKNIPEPTLIIKQLALKLENEMKSLMTRS